MLPEAYRVSVPRWDIGFIGTTTWISFGTFRAKDPCPSPPPPLPPASGSMDPGMCSLYNLTGQASRFFPQLLKHVVGSQKSCLNKNIFTECRISSHRPLVKSVYQKNNFFLISQPKHMLWILLRTQSICSK